MPALQAGAIVLADRYVYTAYVRDTVRGVNRAWLRRLYSFAVPPTLAFYFDVPLDEAMKRISVGRSELKYYEAGMDLGLSRDPAESFRLFQGLIRREYEQVIDEFGLVRMDATRAWCSSSSACARSCGRTWRAPCACRIRRLKTRCAWLASWGITRPSGKASWGRRRDCPAVLWGATAGHRVHRAAGQADCHRRHRRRRALHARRAAEGVVGGARLRCREHGTAPLVVGRPGHRARQTRQHARSADLEPAVRH